MSWLISDDSGSSTAHLNSFDSEKYYSKDSWRLTKNIAFVPPESQKFQTERDLDGFLVTDKDFGFDKKYNGFAIKTSYKPESKTVEGEDLYDSESYNVKTPTTFTKTFTTSVSGLMKQEEWVVSGKVYKGDQFSYTAECKVKFQLSVRDEYSWWGSADDDCYFIVNNGSKQFFNNTTTVELSRGDTIYIASTDSDYSVEYTASFYPLSFYHNKRGISGWESWVKSSTNAPDINIWAPGYIAGDTENGNAVNRYFSLNVTMNNFDLSCDIIAAVYVGGILNNYVSIPKNIENSASTNVYASRDSVPSLLGKIPLQKGDALVTLYVRKDDGVAPKTFIEDELYQLMKRYPSSTESYYVGSLGGGGTNSTSGYTSGFNGYDTSYTLSGPSYTRDKSGYTVSSKSVDVLMKPRFNSIPFTDCSLVKTGRTPPNSNYSYVAPNVKHYKSGFFTVTKEGVVALKGHLHGQRFSTSYDSVQYVSQSITVYKNGNVVYSNASTDYSDKSFDISSNIDVNAGDLIAVSFSGTFFEDTYYQLNYDYDICEKNYLTGPNEGRVYQNIKSKSSYSSTNSDGYDFAFVANSSGTLTASDMYIFINGEKVSSGATVQKGDLVLARINQKSPSYELDNSLGSFTNGEGHYEPVYFTWWFIKVQIGQNWIWDRLEKFEFNFSGSAKIIGYTWNESWEHYVSCIIVEARRWIDDNDLGEDAPFPLAVIDDDNDQDKIDKIFNVLNDNAIYVDLWLDVKNIDKMYDNDNLINHIKAFALNAPVKLKDGVFENKLATQVRIKDATGGVNSFRNDYEAKIGQLELVNISGDWSEAFKGAVTTSAKIGQFTTNELTSAKDMFRGCEIRYQWHLDEDKLKTFFNDTYEKWQDGEYDFRSAFVGCPYSGTIPEKFMSAEDQFACNWDPAILIQKVASQYDIAKTPLTNYYYAGGSAMSDAPSTFVKHSNTIHKLKLISHQYDESTGAGLVYLDDKLLFSHNSRGHCICVLDCQTLAIKFKKTADTYGTPASADSIWTEAINAAGSNDIVFALSMDATSCTGSVRSSIASCGGQSSGTWSQIRYAHTFIGKKGMSSNTCYENWTSGGSYSTLEAQFDETRGLIHKYWTQSFMANILNPVFESRNDFTYEHSRQFPVVEVPEGIFYYWSIVFQNIKDVYDYSLFKCTKNNIANFTLSVLTSGIESQVNPNSETSIKQALDAYSFDELSLHLGKLKNTTNKNITISGMFSGVSQLHCVDCDFIDITDMSNAFEDNDNLEFVEANLDGVEVAEHTFENCDKLKYINAQSKTCYDTTAMCKDCVSLEEYDLIGMVALQDATSMFENCPSLKTEMFTKPTRLPTTLQVAKRMFAKCNISEISGNWVPPNSYTSYRNQDENGIGNLEDDWVNETTKEGWSFPEKLYSAYQMFAENPITKISNLKFNPNANNSWIFQDCHDLTTIKYSFLDVDTYEYGKYTGMFDGCSLKKENVIWLPISISSKFDLKGLGFMVGSGNELPTYWIVDDHWCEVDHSGFVEYQHIRRPAYLDVYRKNYDKDVIIKFWSHPHIHSAEMRGYNELHDTKVYYDPETMSGGTTINYNEWLKGKQTK